MRILFLCNTVYQIMVASWLKKTKYTDVSADVIISDHMNNYGNISDRVRECAFFDKVYKIKSKSYINAKEKISIRERLYRGLRPEKALSDIIKFKGKYDCLFIANLDRFSQSLYNVLKNYKHSKVGNKKLKLYIYEDGIMTYSKLFDKYYKNCIPEFYTWRLKLLNKYICNNQYIFKNVSSMYLFNPDLICYLPDCKIEQIDKIDINDKKFIEYLNYVFSYDSSKDIYDKPIIFIEESIYIDSEQRPDLELLNTIADEVGKENIMIKIHPRNPINIFEKHGYKTNKDTSIPWELIILNNRFQNKRLITIASSAILNPITIFGINIKSYSLYNCLKEKPNILKGDFWDCVKYQYGIYPQNIRMYNNIYEIISEIKGEKK